MAETGQKQTKPLFSLKTYQTLSSHLDSWHFRSDSLHVFSTSEMALIVEKRYGENISSIDLMSRNLFPDFRTGLTELYLQSEIRKKIHAGEYHHEEYLLNRIPALVNTLYALADLDSSEILFDDSGERKTEIMTLMNEMMHDDVIKSYHHQRHTLTKKAVSSLLCGHEDLEEIIFYEVEYLNFGRMNLIHWLQTKGFKIEFCVPYNKEFPAIYDYWKKIYEVAAREDFDSLETEGENVQYGSHFASFNEGISNQGTDRADVEVWEFESPRDFSDYYTKSEDRIAAVNPGDVELLVNDVFSNLYENEYGKFIYYLQFCRKTDETITVSYDNLIELITSAWVSTKTSQGNEALALLQDLQEYMDGTETIEEVRERLDRLSELEMISRTFDNENAQEAGKDRMKRYMLNPFRAFSFIQQGRYSVTIKQLAELVDQTEKLCMQLLEGERDTKKANEYFKQWETVLSRQKNHRDSDSFEFWESVFSTRFPEDWEFAIQELLSLIYLTATKKAGKKETIIHSLPTLPSTILNSDGSRPLHVTNLTMTNFPENHHTRITDFFTHKEMKHHIIHSLGSTPESRRLLHSLWVDYSVNENFSKLGVYQLYNIISSYKGPVKFSWIRHLQEDGFPNMYLDVLADLYQAGKVIPFHAGEDAGSVTLSSEPSGAVPQAEVNEIKGKVPDLFWLDHDLCSKKFFMTALIDQQPVYNQEFHQQFVFSKIGRLFSISAEERDEFRSLIYPLFPQWTYSKKENLIDTEYPAQLRSYKQYDNISYPKEMNRLQILRSVYRENRRTKARNQYRKDTGLKEADLLKQLSENVSRYEVKAEPGSHCKMCPHLQSCSEGMYAIDNISQE